MANHPYRVDKELILVPVTLFGKNNRTHNGSFILDTGASSIIIDHAIAFDLGYSARDGIGFSTVSSAIGKERGYRLSIELFETLGKQIHTPEVHCHNLLDQGVEGLIGMSFLKQFDWCLHPKRQIIATT